jgi:probable phosphoglycerate mutase
MIELLLLRHGVTRWNRQKRLQGRRDIPLSPEGLAKLQQLALPQALAQRPWLHSPLKRCAQTAAALGLSSQPCNAWIEMDWGDWEGQQISQLRLEQPQRMAELETRGLDLLPPNGESPRQVRQRLLSWLEQQPEPQYLGIVTHKGVIRALLSQALEWDMRSSCPIRIDWQRPLLLRWHAPGRLELVDYNLELCEKQDEHRTI